MFGYPAMFVGGNLVTGLFAQRWMIRLPDDDRAESSPCQAPVRSSRWREGP